MWGFFCCVEKYLGLRHNTRKTGLNLEVVSFILCHLCIWLHQPQILTQRYFLFKPCNHIAVFSHPVHLCIVHIFITSFSKCLMLLERSGVIQASQLKFQLHRKRPNTKWIHITSVCRVQSRKALCWKSLLAECNDRSLLKVQVVCLIHNRMYNRTLHT